MIAHHLRSSVGPVGLATLAVLAFALAAGGLRGDEPKAADESGQRFEEMKELVAPLRAARIEGGARVPVGLQKEPLHRWNDPTREFSDGSLWLWAEGGRPAAAVALELYPSRDLGAHWSFELVSLSTGLVEAEADSGFDIVWADLAAPRPDGKLLWAPKSAGVGFKPIPDAPAPGKTEAVRLRQMKSQAQRFSGDEYYEPNKQTYVLRLLPRHVYRYADAKAGVLDGAIFLLAHGTNPEIMVMIECQGKDIDSARWHYGLARLSRAAPTARLDQKVVWTAPHAYKPTSSETYFIARRSRPGQSKPTPGTAQTPRSAQ